MCVCECVVLIGAKRNILLRTLMQVLGRQWWNGPQALERFIELNSH